jgi:hypothetical protein
MIWLLFVVMFIIVALVEGENPLAYPMVWILGGVASIHLLVRSRRQHQESAFSSSPPEVGVDAKPDLDMFHGLRGWNKDECPAEVATAACSLSGRDPAYVRALLVMGTVRGDQAGGVVAAAARRLLRPAHE